MLMLEGKLAGVSFLSRCNVVVGNGFMFMLEGKLVDGTFTS
jgi:hypothetical protein